MTIIMGLDIGLAHCGIAVLDCVGGPNPHITLRAAEVCVTEKRAAKVAVSTTEDNIHRMRKLAAVIAAVYAAHSPSLVVTESQSWPRNAGATGKIGMAWGAIVGVLPASTPILDASPQAIKLAVCKSKSATKDEVITAVEQRLGALPKTIKKADREHAADACAAVLAAIQYREDVKLWISPNRG